MVAKAHLFPTWPGCRVRVRAEFALSPECQEPGRLNSPHLVDQVMASGAPESVGAPARSCQRPACSTAMTRSLGLRATPASLGSATKSKLLALSKAQVATEVLFRTRCDRRVHTLRARPSIGSSDCMTTRRPSV